MSGGNVDDAWERDSSADFEDFVLAALTSHRTLSGKGVGGVSHRMELTEKTKDFAKSERLIFLFLII